MIHSSLLKYSKSSCGVDFLLNTAESTEKRGWFDADKRYRTDFFEFYFFRKAEGPPDALLQADDGADHQRISCGDEPGRETEIVISRFLYQSGSISSLIGSTNLIKFPYFCI